MLYRQSSRINLYSSIKPHLSHRQASPAHRRTDTRRKVKLIAWVPLASKCDRFRCRAEGRSPARQRTRLKIQILTSLAAPAIQMDISGSDIRATRVGSGWEPRCTRWHQDNREDWGKTTWYGAILRQKSGWRKRQRFGKRKGAL